MAYVGGAFNGFPDLRVVIENMIAEDDRVVVRNHLDRDGLRDGEEIGVLRHRDLAHCGALGVSRAAACGRLKKNLLVRFRL